MFALLESHEAPQAGKGKRQDSITDGALGETLGYLLQGVDPVAEPLLWRSLEDKIMGYFNKSSPVNATKVGVATHTTTNANANANANTWAYLNCFVLFSG